MSKIMAIFDTETKSAEISIDDNILATEDFNISSYTNKDCDGIEGRSIYVSFSMKQSDGLSVTYSFSQDFKSDLRITKSENSTTNKNIRDAVSLAIASIKLTRSLVKKPIKEITIEQAILDAANMKDISESDKVLKKLEKKEV